MAEKKAVLNVTVAESLAEAVRHDALVRGTTISSVVEAALAEHIRRELIRADGLAAIQEEYEEMGRYPTPEEEAAAEATGAGRGAAPGRGAGSGRPGCRSGERPVRRERHHGL